MLEGGTRKSKRVESTEADSTSPGVIFLEIDGLAGPIFERAIQHGHMPTLARWLETGTHKMLTWEPDLSSQTAASQAGILLGSNDEIPAFRWYERETKAVMVSSKPRNAQEIEARLSTGTGLLVDGGVSRNNMFSGDAETHHANHECGARQVEARPRRNVRLLRIPLQHVSIVESGTWLMLAVR